MSFTLTPLDQAIANAYANSGDREMANRAWLELLRTNLFLPVNPAPPAESEEAFHPLYAVINEQCFLAAFDTLARFETWAEGHSDKIQHVVLSGRDLIAGMGDAVYLALNPGLAYYKEFSPDEVKHLKKIIAKVDQLKNPS